MPQRSAGLFTRCTRANAFPDLCRQDSAEGIFRVFSMVCILILIFMSCVPIETKCVTNHFQPLSCPGCKTVFKNNSELDDHVCPSQPFKCKFCDKRYTRKESLRRHTREEHSEDGKSQPKIRGQGHTCTTCGMAFEQSYLFK